MRCPYCGDILPKIIITRGSKTTTAKCDYCGMEYTYPTPKRWVKYMSRMELINHAANKTDTKTID